MYHINKEITGNGESLVLNNTAKHYFKDFKILGNSKQETRSGQNLYNYKNVESTTSNVTVDKEGWITATYDNTNGTTTSYQNYWTANLDLEPNTEYAIVREIKNISGTGTLFVVSQFQGSEGQFSTNINNSFKELSANSTAVMKITTKSDLTNTKNGLRTYVGFAAGESGSITFRISVLKDTSVTANTFKYEAFGAAPSIEFEAPIESVGDNINICDSSNLRNGYPDTTIGNTLFFHNSSVTVTYQKCAHTKKATEYTISHKINTVANTNGRVAVIVDSNNKVLQYFTINPQLSKNSFTSEYDGDLYLSMDINATDIKIVEGTSTGAYSPHGQGSIEIKQVNKNFLDLNKKPYDESSSVLNGAKVIVNDGILNVDATNSTGTVTIRSSWASYKDNSTILLPKGTYYTNVRLNLTDTKSLTSKQFSKGTFTIEEAHYLTQWFLQVAQGKKATIILQIEQGEKQTNYIEYQSQTKALYTQQPFRAIGDVKDRFFKKDGVWYEEHKIKHFILNGTENWYISGDYFARYNVPNAVNAKLKSTHFKYIKEWTNVVNNAYMWGTTIYISMASFSFTTADEFKAWLSEQYTNGTPVIIDYELETPTLIECTPEQVEQLEEIEKEMYSYDEVTNIYSTDTISPYFDVSAYQRISEEIKTRLKEGKITRGYLKVLATDTLPEIIIDENNYLKDLKIEELRYVPEEGFIGGAVAKRVSGNFNNVDNSFDIQDREVEVYLGVELEDETTEYIKYGTYIVQRPEDDQVTDNTSFEALDYMVKFNQEYKDRITYPCTLKELLNDVLDQAGVNSKTNTFANSDFIVENNQFEQGTTLRDVIKAIAQVAFNWARIDEDDNFVMDFEINEKVDEELSTDDYFGFKKTDDYGPINVIVLRNSQIEGENVTIKDEKLINSPKGHNLLPIETINTTINNVTIVNNGDGSITLNGATSGYLPITIFANKEIKFKPDTYTIKKKEISGTYTTSSQFLELQDENSQRVMFFGGISGNASLSQEKIVTKCYIAFATGTVFDNYTFALSLTDSTNSEKPYQPYIPVGEVELVIADNPFAYTELKRKQLIEAGRRLFGLRYTPMTVDMLGLMYLNAKDRISVENLNGEKFNTYLLDHTIDYTGIVLDSMESKAKTQTETKYQYISPLSQGISHVEIKVDKANKRIDAIVKDQEDVSEKVANTVARIEVVYALSDSPSEPPTEGWDTTAPPWVEGKYMWQKTITTYANGTSVETAATNISGAQGKDGISGNNSYSYVAFANSADGSKDFSRTDSTNKTYIGTLTINESVNENLLKKTNQGITNWRYNLQNGTSTYEAYEPTGVNGIKLICEVASTGYQYVSYNIDIDTLNKIKENTSYILSFDIQTNIGTQEVGISIRKDNATNIIANQVKADILGDETWEHFSVELKTIEDFSNITIGNQVIYITGLNKVGYYIIKNLKLEEGYRESSYSKSPEDLADDYTKYYWQYTKGEEGIGVSEVVDEYYLSTSDTDQIGGEWKETQDAFEEGKYIWTRSKITWTNGSITYTIPILANTLNDINSNIVVLRELSSSQIIENGKIITRIEETTKRLNNDYSTTEQVDSKIDGLEDKYETLEKRFVDIEASNKEYAIKINAIDNNGVDKIKTLMGYTFNDEGLNIDRPEADTGTIVNETGIQVLDKTGAKNTPLLYAGYVKEGNSDFPDYEGQTIVASSNLIVRNFLVIGSNSRFQDYINPILGGQGTGAYDI